MGRWLCAIVLGISVAAGGMRAAGEAASRLTRQQQEEFVRAHNQWRRQVRAPDLRWSADLAAHAEAWAATLAARGCSLHTSGAEDLGENLSYYSASGPSASRLLAAVTPASVVGDWTSEASNYSYQRNACARGKRCGHYTQVVWSRTREVGCGMAACSRGEEIWVCNYRPAGNVRGQRPY